MGKETKIGKNDVYITGTNKDVAILISKSGAQDIRYQKLSMTPVHDVYGWTFTNTRVLADHYAKEADATVFIPDL